MRRSVLVQQIETASLGSFAALPLTKTSAQKAAVMLLDSIGELAALYCFATVVFVGGSLVPKGGHNILGPAREAKPIIVGPYMENFREIAQEFQRHNALLQVQGANDKELIAALSEALIDLLRDDARVQVLGANARTTVEANRGATAKTVEVLADLI